MQYSPPKIAYVPGYSKMTEFAICEPVASMTIQLAQAPGKATTMKLNATGLIANAPVQLVVNKFGRVDCTATGPEYRPLAEVDKYGGPNPYQVPARGRIPQQTADATGAITDVLTRDILLNLSGHDSIIGRSIVVSDLSVNPTTGDRLVPNPIGCCIIGIDESPMMPSTPKYPAYGHGHGYGHGYGYQHQHGHHDHDDDLEHPEHDNDYFGSHGMSSYMSMPGPRFRPRYGKSSYRPRPRYHPY